MASLEVLEGIAHPIFVKDRMHRFVYLNEAACALFARPPEDMLGRTDHDFVPKEQADAFCAIDDEVLATGEDSQVEEVFTDPTGVTKTFLTRKRRATIPGADGPEDVIVVSIFDITELRLSINALRENDARFREMADGAPVMIWVTNAAGESTMFNQLWTDVTGQAEADALGTGWLNCVHDDDRERVLATFIEASASLQPVEIEYRLRRRDGSWAWVLDQGRPRLTERDEFAGYVGALIDISERRAAELALERSERRLSTVFGQTMVGILHRDLDNRVLMVNQRFCELLGRTKEELDGLPMHDFTHPDDYPANERKWLKHVRTGEPFQLEKRYLRPDGEAVWCEVSVSFIMDAHGRPESTIVVIQDIALRRQAEQERLQAQQQLAHLASHDVLTGIANRGYFLERIDEMLRVRGNHLIALHYIDLDGFKEVNDTLGHAAGDALLYQVGRRLEQCIGEADILARLGGDEFAIAQRSPPGPDSARRLAEKIIDALAVPFDIEGAGASVGASIGIAFAPIDAGHSSDLLKAADTALYRAKSGKRGSYCMFERGMDAAMRTRHLVRIELAGAMSRGELELHYQPLFDIASNHITACEALARWRHPERGLIPPNEFIPVAEESGLIIPLGAWVLEKACADAARWPIDAAVAVNLSPLQFRNSSLVDTVAKALAAADLRPDRLQLEITESVLLDDSAGNLATLRALRQLGVRIAMDDFGTGYSSFGYLRSFPFDKIKVDREFVRDLPDSPESLAILRAVVGLGQSLGMTTTVEGVETQDQLSAVRTEGFVEAQGYLLGVPVPNAEMVKILHGHRPVRGRVRSA
ncbi:sensor domain-containing protein [Devosia nitrariae]|nr:bifunctional diguanylate cyclase/phosphodiesterase [Devosia nitrariae]